MSVFLTHPSSRFKKSEVDEFCCNPILDFRRFDPHGFSIHRLGTAVGSTFLARAERAIQWWSFLLMFTLENCKGLSPKIQPQVGGLQLADIKSIQVISKCIQVLCYDLLCDWAGQKPSFCRNVQDVFLQLYMISFALRKGWRLAAGRLVDRFGVGRKTVQSLEIPNWSSQHGCFLF